MHKLIQNAQNAQNSCIRKRRAFDAGSSVHDITELIDRFGYFFRMLERGEIRLVGNDQREFV